MGWRKRTEKEKWPGHDPGAMPEWERGGPNVAHRWRYGGPYGPGTAVHEHDDHTGRGPRGYRRSDERIHDDVCARLTDDGWIDASDIDVRVGDGVVHLQGEVDSRATKRRAEEICDTVPGVKDVMNELRIRHTERP